MTCAPWENCGRYDVAILLDQGMVYTDILEKTGASSATISRVNRIFSFGAGGFRRMIQRRKEKGSADHGAD